jgi:hypothetical protein
MPPSRYEKVAGADCWFSSQTLCRRADLARHDSEIRQGSKAAAHVYGALSLSMEKSRPALLPPPPIAITQ